MTAIASGILPAEPSSPPKDRSLFLPSVSAARLDPAVVDLFFERRGGFAGVRAEFADGPEDRQEKQA